MLEGIKSKFTLVKICSHINKKLLMKLLKKNKKLKSKLNISLNDYKNYYKIFIEMIPIETIEENQIFINYERKYKSCYHIYFNNDEKETKKDGVIGFFKYLLTKNNFITKIDNVKKIRIIIDNRINSLKGLFKDCKYLKEINFIQFNYKNIYDMSEMFSNCTNLEQLNILNIKTDKVTNMDNMFYNCKKLTKLNLKNFNMNNVVSMKAMFCGCNSLEDLDFLIFDTSNVIEMNDLFFNCSSLKELNIYNKNGIYDKKDMNIIHNIYPSLYKMDIFNFKTSKVRDMSSLFDSCYLLKKFYLINFDTSRVKAMNRIFMGCSSLTDIDLSKFKVNKDVSVYCSFKECTENLIDKVKNQVKNINENAFGGK